MGSSGFAPKPSQSSFFTRPRKKCTLSHALPLHSHTLPTHRYILYRDDELLGVLTD
jgi:hypothetical protein